MLRSRTLRAACSVVSPGAGLSLASKFWDRPRLIVCWGSLRVGVTDQRRDRMTDPGDGPDPGEEPEEGGAEAGAELKPLALLQELPVRELVSDHERSRRRLVHDRDAGLELPRSREQRRQVDPGLPVDGRTERLVEQYPAAPTRDGRIHDVELLPRIADVVGQVETVGPVPGPDAERCLKPQGRDPVVGEQGVEGAARQQDRRLNLVERLLIGERKPGRPGDGRRQVDRRRCEAHRRYGLGYETAPDLLPSVPADAERPPVELLGEARLRTEARGREVRVHRIGLNDLGAGRVVDARAEPRT